jgi:hypothetical protein
MPSSLSDFGSKLEADARTKAIKGAHGRAIRASARVLQAEDEFFKSIIYQMEIGARALSIARSEGLEGKALSDRITYLMGDPHGEAHMQARDEALRLTWQAETDNPIFDLVRQLRTRVPGARYILPFLTTPWNIFKTGATKSPLGGIAMLYKAVNHARGKEDYTRRQVVHDLAEQIWAWIGFSLFTKWAAPSDDEDGDMRPMITGNAPESPGERDLMYRTAPPLSVRIGKEYFSYKFIEPYSTTFGFMADAVRMIHQAKNGAESTAVFDGLWNSVKGSVRDKTFMAGLSDLSRLADDFSGQAPVWASNFASSWVPNIVRSPLHANDDYIRSYEHSVSNFGKPFWGEFIKNTKWKMLPLASINTPPPPKVGLWGQTAKKHSGGSPLTDFIHRVASPLQKMNTRANEAMELDYFIWAWNVKHPYDKMTKRPPDRYFDRTFNGQKERYEIDDSLIEEYLVKRGEMALDILRGTKFNPAKPKVYEKKMINQALNNATKFVNNVVLKSQLSEHLKSGRIRRVDKNAGE